jgi:branched-subunit amino acid aminotransferase/4-amino-4-deoxychorismate lyase
MRNPVAFINGRFVEADGLSIPVTDAGFVMGVTVAEQLRTFNGSLFLLEEHLRRLHRSLRTIGIELAANQQELGDACRQVASRNYSLLESGDDLGLCIFVTPGPYPTYDDGGETKPTVCIHTYPLPFSKWWRKYESGQVLVTTRFRQIDRENWPLDLKCRSRMHYYLADRAACDVEPSARALLLDRNNHVSEASTANVLTYSDDVGFTSPDTDSILPGISLGFAARLVDELGIPFRHADLMLDDLYSAQEMLLTSTPWCVLPVVCVNDQSIGRRTPGPMFAKLLALWSERSGVDIAGQAKKFAQRPEG